MMQKISIVEDDIDIQDILKNHLMAWRGLQCLMIPLTLCC